MPKLNKQPSLITFIWISLGFLFFFILTPIVLRLFGIPVEIHYCFNNTVPCGWEANIGKVNF